MNDTIVGNVDDELGLNLLEKYTIKPSRPKKPDITYELTGYEILSMNENGRLESFIEMRINGQMYEFFCVMQNVTRTNKQKEAGPAYVTLPNLNKE